MSTLKRLYRYYGMCGAFKATTIKSLLHGPRLGYCLPVWSMSKPWQRLRRDTMKDLLRPDSNLDLAALSLCTLEHTLWTAAEDPDIEIILAERGVLDNLYYWANLGPQCYSTPAERKESVISQVRNEERRIQEEHNAKETKNVLLVMEDEEFIKTHILSEPTRISWFPDVPTYLTRQKDYIGFLREWIVEKEKGVLEERRITNAKEYLEEKLKITYKP